MYFLYYLLILLLFRFVRVEGSVPCSKEAPRTFLYTCILIRFKTCFLKKIFLCSCIVFLLYLLPLLFPCLLSHYRSKIIKIVNFLVLADLICYALSSSCFYSYFFPCLLAQVPFGILLGCIVIFFGSCINFTFQDPIFMLLHLSFHFLTTSLTTIAVLNL